MGLGRWTAPLAAGALMAAGLAIAPAHAAGNSGSGTGDAIEGPLTSGDSLFPNQGNGGYDVSHYDVDITWTPGVPGGTIDATTTIQATTTGEPLSSFGLDLEGLTVTSVVVDNVAVPPAGIERIEEAEIGGIPGKHKLKVTPAAPVEGPFTVVVEYGGVPETRHDTDGSDEGWIPTADGATFMNQPIGSMTGFPNNNNPKDKATYTFTVDVPETLEVVSNGEPQGTFPPMPSGGRATWVWKQTQPMASELVLVSIGQYIVRTGTVNLSGGRTVPEFSFLDATLNQTTFDARRAELSSVLTGLEAFLGPYPGKSTGIVVDVTGVGYALETQDRPTWPSTASVSGSFVHELTHQWYGDAVAPADWNGLWVNEGMATWAPEHLEGNNNENAFFGEWSTTGAGSSLWNLPPSGMTVPSQMFGWQSYDRGAMTYEALRAAIGDPAFFQLIKQWQTDFGGQTKKWTDLIALAQQISGRDLTAFFQDWIYDPNKPAWPGKLSLVLSATPGPGAVAPGSTVTYQLTATNTGKVPLAGAVVSVDLSGVLDDATIGVLPAGLGLAGTTLTWTVPATPVSTPNSPSVATTSFPVTVRPNATQGSSLTATSTVSTLGGTCMTCSVTHTVVPSSLGAECQVGITGQAKVGRKLKARMSGCPALTVANSYQWFAGGKRIKGATKATYKVKRSKLGKRITVRVTVSAPGYVAADRVSPKTRKVRR